MFRSATANLELAVSAGSVRESAAAAAHHRTQADARGIRSQGPLLSRRARRRRRSDSKCGTGAATLDDFQARHHAPAIHMRRWGRGSGRCGGGPSQRHHPPPPVFGNGTGIKWKLAG